MLQTEDGPAGEDVTDGMDRVTTPANVAITVRAMISAGAMMNLPPFLCHIWGLTSVITRTDEKKEM